MLSPLQECSLYDVLDFVREARSSVNELAAQHPLRCLKRISQDEVLNIQPYRAADQYVAISYTWPGAWTRLYSSAKSSTILRDGKQITSEHISKFMVIVFDYILSRYPSEKLSFWVDYACINQADGNEKAQQVAVMDRIYTQARFTAVMLEDVELTTDEFRSLNASGPRTTIDERERHVALTTRVLGAQWFKRAWCSQEMILSRSTSFYLHCTDEPAKPFCVGVPVLVLWLSKARNHEPSTPRIAEPRGGVDHVRLASMATNSYAWAFGVIRGLGCYNLYDKISLAQNLVRTPLHMRLTSLPDTKGLDDMTAELNVAKILNVMAVQSGDFSLLQTGHVDASYLIQREYGFGWAGVPTKTDIVSAGWHAKQYQMERDQSAALTASGLRLSGFVALVRAQEFWSVRRQEDTLYISVDAKVKVIRPTWLRSSPDDVSHNVGSDAYSREQPLSRLGDIIYAIEAFDADHIWPNFMPADGNWVTRGPNDGVHSSADGPLRKRILQEYDRPTTVHRSMAEATSFCQRGNMTTFSVVTLASGESMVVDGNAGNVVGKELFQPYVMRLKEFGSDRLACNAVVLQGVQSEKPRDLRLCAGHLRSFSLLPESTKVETIILR